MSRRRRTAVLISGRGTNMMKLVGAAADPGYPAEIVKVIADRPEAAGLFSAEAAGVSAAHVDRRRYRTREEFESALDAELVKAAVELVCLAGFMRVLSPEFVGLWQDRVINIHPSLLPSFPGLDTHRRALDAGVKVHGCTVHFVRPAIDDGPIVAQAAVPVLAADTEEALAARVLAAEHKIYPMALALVASGRAKVAGGRVALDTIAPERGGRLIVSPFG